MTVDHAPPQLNRRPNYAIAFAVHQRVLANARTRFLGRPRWRHVPAGNFCSVQVHTLELSDPWTEEEIRDFARRESVRQLGILERDAKIIGSLGFMHLATASA